MRAFVLSVFLLMTLPVWSADFGKGVECHITGDYACALRELQPLAEQGDANAQNRLGVMYDYGQGVQQDYEEAAKWYRKAAEQGNDNAQNNLAFLYAKGQGVQQDYTEAVKWWRKAAEQGNDNAQHNLGIRYANGEGVDKNKAWAVYWYAKAAQQGRPLDIELLSARQSLNQLTVTKPTINIREEATTNSKIVGTANQGDILYRLDTVNDWYEVYMPSGHVLGFVASFLVEEKQAQQTSAQNSGPYPARPVSVPGRVSCNTRCVNGDCYRTYDDGRKVRFQAQQKYNMLSGQWEWDSGGC